MLSHLLLLPSLHPAVSGIQWPLNRYAMKEEMTEKLVAPVSDWPVLPPKPLERGLLLVLVFNATRQEFF